MQELPEVEHSIVHELTACMLSRRVIERTALTLGCISLIIVDDLIILLRIKYA